MHQYIFIVTTLWFINTQAFSEMVPFSSERWTIEGKESKIVNYNGNESLFLQGGMAYLNDVDFLNGIIEFDISISKERGFMGAVWRLQDENNHEEFYIRPHQSGNPDANQYTPVFNALASWQLYHGEGYGAPVTYKYDKWMHIKIVISGSVGEVYIDDMEIPALVIHELKREVKAGKIGVQVRSNSPAHFANFQYTLVGQPTLKGEVKPIAEREPNSIQSWDISKPFKEELLLEQASLSNLVKDDLQWQSLFTENSGLANLARISDFSQGNTVFAKISIESESDQIKKLSLGYSDRVRVYLNDQLLYSGNNGFQTRDYRYLGTIGYFDEVYLDLRSGKNELWLAVSESFGGWGIKAKFENFNQIKISP